MNRSRRNNARGGLAALFMGGNLILRSAARAWLPTKFAGRGLRFAVPRAGGCPHKGGAPRVTAWRRPGRRKARLGAQKDKFNVRRWALGSCRSPMAGALTGVGGVSRERAPALAASPHLRGSRSPTALRLMEQLYRFACAFGSNLANHVWRHAIKSDLGGGFVCSYTVDT